MCERLCQHVCILDKTWSVLESLEEWCGWLKREMKQMPFLSWGNVKPGLCQQAAAGSTGLVCVYVYTCVFVSVCGVCVFVSESGRLQSVESHLSTLLPK